MNFDMSVALTILKIIGIILGVILGLAIFILLVVLFLPVVYNIRGHKLDDSYDVKVKVHYLIPFLNFKLDFDDKNGLKYVARFLFFKLISSDAEPEKPKKPNKPTKPKKIKSEVSEKKSEHESQSASDYREFKVFDNGLDIEADNESETYKSYESKEKDIKADTVIDDSETDAKAEQPQKKKSLVDFFVNMKSRIVAFADNTKTAIENIKEKKDYLDEKLKILKSEDTQNAIKKIFAALKKLLKTINPKKKRVTVDIGFSDPATTGQVVAAYSVMYPVIGSFVFLNADYEKPMLRGDAYFKGSLNIFTVLLIGLKLYFDDEFNKLIRNFS